jgi:hypothetical protein
MALTITRNPKPTLKMHWETGGVVLPLQPLCA